MEIELGKWLLDISKYLVTALLLTTAFSDMNNPWIVLIVFLSAVFTLSVGLWLIKKNEKKSKTIKSK